MLALIVLPAIARASPATASSYIGSGVEIMSTGSILTLLVLLIVPAFYFLVIIMMMQLIVPPDIVESFVVVGSTPRWSCNHVLIASAQ